MKKVLSLLLMLLMAASVTACGKNDTLEEEVSQEESVEEEGTETNDTSTNDTSTNETITTSSNSKSKVLLDNSLMKITFKETSIDVDDDVLNNMKIVFEVENKSGSNLNLAVNNLAANGKMINTTVDADLPTGEKTRVDMRLYKDEVAEFKNIEGNFYIRNIDENKQVANYDFELFEEDNYFSNRKSSEVLVLDNELINIKLVKKLEASVSEVSTHQGPSIRLEIQNKTSQDISINPDDMSVAGVPVKVNTYFTVAKNSTIKENIEFGKDVQALSNIQGKIKVSCKEDVTKAGDFVFSIQ